MGKMLVVTGAVIALVGCAGLNKQFVAGIDGYAQVILPEYRAYVDKDTSLSPSTKKIRVESADGMRALIDEAQKASDK